MDPERRYAAMASRDERFDGRFFVAVTSTKIYCRPSCPVPPPMRRNVRFYPTAEAAEAAGFRACRRCRPEASPDSPDWDVRADLVGRALRLIAEGVVDTEGVAGLAHRLSTGQRQLHRTFVDELGIGPLAVARSRRARLAKQLLEQTDLRSADVAFASGFASVRAYNDTVRSVFRCSPGEIRARRRRADVHEGALTLRLAYRPPFAAGPLFRFLGDRAIPGVETFDGTTLRRSIRARDGSALLVGLTPDPRRPHVTLEVSPGDPPELATVVQAARRLLDLDADPVTIDGCLARDPALSRSVRALPGLRLPGAVDGFELAVRAVLGQQISVAGARTMAGRLVERTGTPLSPDERADGVTHLFPTAAQVANASFDGIGLTGRRAATLRQLAELVAGGDLDLSGHGDPEAALDKLLAIPGVGGWTAAYVAMRALRDPDAFPATDLGIRAGLQAAALPTVPAAALVHAERWRPWRGYAAMHLWQIASTRGRSLGTRVR
jgi:AraC family transcriptional regulator of adaptative response / DNA-3-methyladenine glycosylase II